MEKINSFSIDILCMLSNAYFIGTSTAHGWNLSCCAKTQRSAKPLGSMYCQRTINFFSDTASSEFCKPCVS